MKKFNWITAIIFNVLTFGIYSMYMWYVMTKNNNAMAEKYGVKKITGFIVAVLLGFITFGIYQLIWYYKFHAQQIAIAQAAGTKTAPCESAFLLFIITFVPIYSFYVMCDNYNKCVDASEAA